MQMGVDGVNSYILGPIGYVLLVVGNAIYVGPWRKPSPSLPNPLSLRLCADPTSHVILPARVIPCQALAELSY